MSRRGIGFVLLVILLSGYSFSVMASGIGDIDFRGRLELDKRFLTDQKPVVQYPIYQTLALELDATPSDNVDVRIGLEARFYDFPDVHGSLGLSSTDSLSPYDLLVGEVYADIFDPAEIEGLELKAGRQRIAWGTADRLNPTDNLNPDDFSDFFDFGEKLPSWALQVNYEPFGDVIGFSAVYIPCVTPVLLPRFGGFSFGEDQGSVENMLPPGFSIASTMTEFINHGRDWDHSMEALKISGTVFETDWSLSWFHGFDDVPYPSMVSIMPAFPDTYSVAVVSDMDFPRMDVLGGDLAGELFSVGWWVESAMFMPEKTESRTVQWIGAGVTDTTMSVVLEDEPYIKTTIGIDYTFPWGSYINVQYSHGFFTERGVDELHDYIFGRLEHSVLNDNLTFSIGGILESDGFTDMKDNYGEGVFPEICWSPFDNLEVRMGYFSISGEGNSLFSGMSDQDQLYFKLKVSF